jgi:hypothetical protein
MARRDGLSSRMLREAAQAARRLADSRETERRASAEGEFPEAAQTAQRVFQVAVEARRSGESGDVSPVLWAPIVVASEMMAAVVVRAYELPGGEETLYDVAAYFTAAFIAGGHGFDRAHFEAWRARSQADTSDGGDALDVEPG